MEIHFRKSCCKKCRNLDIDKYPYGVYNEFGHKKISEGSEYMNCEKCSKCEECEKSTHRTDEEKKKLNKRLNIIDGQIRGIKQMIEDDRYCADILIQLSAINKSLESVENAILESHIKSCVLNEIQNGNADIIDEVMELFKRLR